MKIISKFMLLTGLSIIIISCTKDETEDSLTDNTIAFNSIVDNFTRASNTYGVIDLAVLRSSTDGFVVSTNGLGTGNEMSNVVVKYTSNAWNYTGTYNWPNMPSQNVSFTAYAPAGTTNATLTSSGLTVSSFTPATSPANQIDLIYAPPANFNRQGSGISGVSLNFNHILTQVVFAATTTIPLSNNPKIVSLELTVPHNKGSFNGIAWKTSGPRQTFMLFNNNSLTSTAITSTPLLIIPQTSLDKTNVTITTSVNGNITTKTIDLSSLSTVTSWNPGNRIVYNISVQSVAVKKTNTSPIITISAGAEERFN